MNNVKRTLVAACVFCGLVGCDTTSTRVEQQDMEKQQEVYVKTQPTPFFDWSFERHLMIKLYEARNNAIATYSYLQSPYTGKIMSSCPSLGYPIPATTQLTNPEKVYMSPAGSYVDVIPQAEPNGLYSPPATSATWVMCVGPDGNVEPVYWESNVQTYPRPMKEVDGALVPVEGEKSSISINPARESRK